MDRKALDTLIDQLPARLREEVFDYASFLLERKVPRPQGVRQANLHPGATRVKGDFDAPLGEQFWLGE